jgi:hypothetical protein
MMPSSPLPSVMAAKTNKDNTKTAVAIGYHK